MAPRFVAMILLSLMGLFQTSGCYSFRAVTGPLPEGNPGWENSQQEYRLLLTGDRSVVLFNLRADSLTISGIAVDGSGSLTVQRTEVLAVEKKGFSELKSFGMAVLLVVPVILLDFTQTNWLG